MRDYTDFMTKVQEDALDAIKHAQDASLTAFTSMHEYATKHAPDFSKPNAFEAMPTTTEVIERSFDFASKFIEMQKEYAIKASEYAASAGKKAAETTIRASRPSKHD